MAPFLYFRPYQPYFTPSIPWVSLYPLSPICTPTLPHTLRFLTQIPFHTPCALRSRLREPSRLTRTPSIRTP